MLALRAADPQGGLPWGMRLVHTTRGEICVQIGRLNDGQLGQLGIDGAFHDDGRFHPLAPDVLPEVQRQRRRQLQPCHGVGQDRQLGSRGPQRGARRRNAARFKPTAKDLRSISWGLLGPHAVSVTYRPSAGVRTRPVAPGTGAYLIVRTVSHVPGSIGGGAEFWDGPRDTRSPPQSPPRR